MYHLIGSPWPDDLGFHCEYFGLEGVSGVLNMDSKRDEAAFSVIPLVKGRVSATTLFIDKADHFLTT